MHNTSILVVVTRGDQTTNPPFLSRTEAVRFITHPDNRDAVVDLYDNGYRVPVQPHQWGRLMAWEAGFAISS